MPIVALLACTPGQGGFGTGDEGMLGDATGSSSSGGPGPTASTSTTTADSTGGTSSATTSGADASGGTSSSSSGTTADPGDGTTDTSSTGVIAESSSGGPPPQSLPELDCMDEGLLSSMGGDPAEITWHNESGELRRIFWLSFMGDRVSYGQLDPGGTAVQGTFATHPWLIANDMDECITIFMAEPGNHDVYLY